MIFKTNLLLSRIWAGFEEVDETEFEDPEVDSGFFSALQELPEKIRDILAVQGDGILKLVYMKQLYILVPRGCSFWICDQSIIFSSGAIEEDNTTGDLSEASSSAAGELRSHYSGQSQSDHSGTVASQKTIGSGRQAVMSKFELDNRALQIERTYKITPFHDVASFILLEITTEEGSHVECVQRARGVLLLVEVLVSYGLPLITSISTWELVDISHVIHQKYRDRLTVGEEAVLALKLRTSLCVTCLPSQSKRVYDVLQDELYSEGYNPLSETTFFFVDVMEEDIGGWNIVDLALFTVLAPMGQLSCNWRQKTQFTASRGKIFQPLFWDSFAEDVENNATTRCVEFVFSPNLRSACT